MLLEAVGETARGTKYFCSSSVHCPKAAPNTVGWHRMYLKGGLWPQWTLERTSLASSKTKHKQCTGPKLSRSDDAEMMTSSQKILFCSSLMIWSTIRMLCITSHVWWYSGWWSGDLCARKWSIFPTFAQPNIKEKPALLTFLFLNWNGHHKQTSLFWVKTWMCVMVKLALWSTIKAIKAGTTVHIQCSRPESQKADPALWQCNTFTQQVDCSVCASGSNTAQQTGTDKQWNKDSARHSHFAQCPWIAAVQGLNKDPQLLLQVWSGSSFSTRWTRSMSASWHLQWMVNSQWSAHNMLKNQPPNCHGHCAVQVQNNLSMMLIKKSTHNPPSCWLPWSWCCSDCGTTFQWYWSRGLPPPNS